MKHFANGLINEVEASASRQLKSAALLVVGIKLGKITYKLVSQ